MCNSFQIAGADSFLEVRMLSGSNPSGEVEVILDSGSDVSILPEAWSSIGTQGKMPPLQCRDAQGNSIKITRPMSLLGIPASERFLQLGQ